MRLHDFRLGGTVARFPARRAKNRPRRCHLENFCDFSEKLLHKNAMKNISLGIWGSIFFQKLFSEIGCGKSSGK